jgi:hypothetical protein
LRPLPIDEGFARIALIANAYVFSRWSEGAFAVVSTTLARLP